LDAALFRSDYEIFRIVLTKCDIPKHRINITLCHSISEDPKFTKKLLKHGADPNWKDRYGLIGLGRYNIEILLTNTISIEKLKI
jgi:hypothetical protein